MLPLTSPLGNRVWYEVKKTRMHLPFATACWLPWKVWCPIPEPEVYGIENGLKWVGVNGGLPKRVIELAAPLGKMNWGAILLELRTPRISALFFETILEVNAMSGSPITENVRRPEEPWNRKLQPLNASRHAFLLERTVAETEICTRRKVRTSIKGRRAETIVRAFAEWCESWWRSIVWWDKLCCGLYWMQHRFQPSRSVFIHSYGSSDGSEIALGGSSFRQKKGSSFSKSKSRRLKWSCTDFLRLSQVRSRYTTPCTFLGCSGILFYQSYGSSVKN